MSEKELGRKILKGLNSEQKKAVVHGQGPLLIIAGAGTGKTTVITRRVAWLILNNLVKTDQILALTFTDKAAQEMEERIDKILPYGYVDLWISTFHSFCERILQQHALDIGLPLNFKLLNQAQQSFLIQDNFDKFDLDYYRPLGNPTKFIQSLVKHFSRAKDELISPEEYLDYVENLKLDKDTSMSDEILDQETSRLKEIANAYHTYQQLLLENNALDFGDLINYTLKLFEKRPQILKKYQEQFKYILVDEFQDTNWAQYKLLQMLAQPKNNMTAVSDDDQSVYKFRGASYNNVLQFKKDYPKTEQVVLIKNYRSQQKILDLAYNFIQLNNPERLEAQDKNIVKKLKAEKKEKGEIVHLHLKTQEDEAKAVIKKIIELKEKDKEASWNDFAILVRANHQAELFVQALRLANVSHQFLARSGLFSKPVILDILAYLKLLDNYHESTAVYRVLTSPIFNKKINSNEVSHLINFANKKSWSVYEAMQKATSIFQLSKPTITQLNLFLSWIDKHTELAKTENVSKVVYAFLQDTGYLKILSNQEDSESIFWLNQFFKKIENFEAINFDKSVGTFIRLIDLMISTGDTGSIDAELEQGPESVKVSTIHSAKGLEFKYVFIVNLVDKRFPSIDRKEPIELPLDLIKEIIPKGDVHLQEERRLFYVALTRAKHSLYLTSAEDYGGKTLKKSSRFLYELGLVKKEKPVKVEDKIDVLIKPLAKQEKKEKTDITLPLRFSFSQFMAFNTCPLQYKFGFILRIPRQGRYVFSFGRSLHNTLYRFCQMWRGQKDVVQKDLFGEKKSQSKKQLSLDDLIKMYEQSWIEDWYESKDHQEKYKEKGKRALKMFYHDFVQNKPRMKYLEKQFNFKLDKYIIRGVIDRIDETDQGHEIIDYKTGQNKGSLGFEKKQQLYLYQLAAQHLPQAFDRPVHQLTFYYLETGERVSFLGKDDDLKKVEENALKTIEKIKKGNFPPQPSRICRFCDFYNICQYRQE